MENFLNFISSINFTELLGAITAILGGLIIIFSFVPGEQPEKTLQAILDFISKFSKK